MSLQIGDMMFSNRSRINRLKVPNEPATISTAPSEKITVFERLTGPGETTDVVGNLTIGFLSSIGFMM